MIGSKSGFITLPLVFAMISCIGSLYYFFLNGFVRCLADCFIAYELTEDAQELDLECSCGSIAGDLSRILLVSSLLFLANTFDFSM